MSTLEPVTAVVCLGVPCAGADVDDALLGVRAPTLFVLGQRATHGRPDDVEHAREKMRADNALVVVGGADDALRMSRADKKRLAVTQATVDRCIQVRAAAGRRGGGGQGGGAAGGSGGSGRAAGYG